MEAKELQNVISKGVSDGLWRFFWSVVGVVFLISIIGLLALLMSAGY